VTKVEFGSLESLREHNRRRVVEALRNRGTASRAELARVTGLSRSTVSTLVSELQATGLVVERAAQPGEHDGRGQGRPPVLLTFDRSAGAVVGIDFGHADVRVAVSDLSRTILGERVVDLDVDHAGTKALDAAAGLVDEVLQLGEVPRERVLAAGMALSGPVDHEGDALHRSAILPSWGGIRPGAEMTARLGLPVFIDNDANLGALAEATMGAARGLADVVYVMVAAGIGAGILVGGRVLHGAGGTAGEIGHVLVDANGPICRCGNRGCLETLAAGPAIVALLERTHGPDLTLDAVLELVRQGDPSAQRALTDAGHAVGSTLAGLVNLLNPQAIVIGGELSAAGEALLDPIRTAIDRHAIGPAARDVGLHLSELGDRAEVLGALILAAQHADVPSLVPKVPVS
jgi:predicted NBD/HSP70 family sugar kinase/biotin operon repressor